MQHKPLHKTHQKKKTGKTQGVYAVTSLSALAEYLRHRPEMIIGIRYRPENKSKVLSALGTLPPGIVVIEDDSIHGLVEALVKINLLSEEDFYDEIRRSDQKNMLIVVLDHLQDPRNFGSIVRTSGFYGVPYVVVAKDRQALLTDAAVATAQGGFAVVQVVQAVNLARVVDKLKEHGFWVSGLDMGGQNLEERAPCNERSALVLGSEGKGISQNLLKRCDYKWVIGKAGHYLDSLNVSVACGIAIHSFQTKVERAEGYIKA